MASLLVLGCLYLHLSWRRWPDLQIDFGRELYVPWRLAEGDVLGRDVESPFGPLSQYFNAGLFALFGPSFMLLVGANLAIYSAILWTAYQILRQGWGVLGAWGACAIFVTVFSFSQYLWTGNYNYAAPYAHEATHGFLVCLLLASVLASYLRTPTSGKALFAGVLFGLTAVLKIEYVAAGAVVVATALALRRQPHDAGVARRHAAAFAIAATLPTLAFVVHFARHMSWTDAFLTTGKGWLTVFLHDRLGTEIDQRIYLGIDQPLRNLQNGAEATLLGLGLVGALLLGARWLDSLEGVPRVPRWARWLAASGLVALACTAGVFISWLSAGRGLFAMTLVAGLFSLRQHRGHPETRPAATVRLLVTALALALMLRMALNVRFHHYGFVQAALAAMTMTATLLADWPQRWLTGRFARNTLRLALLALLVIGAGALTRISIALLERKGTAVGLGADMFYHFTRDSSPEREIPPDDSILDPPFFSEANSDLVRQADEMAAQFLEQRLAAESDLGNWFKQTVDFLSRTSPDATIMVLSEGVMINYLARRKTPLAVTKFFGAELAHGREAQLVAELRQRPPGHVVLVSRDLRDLGVSRFGAKPGEGQLLLRWIAENYSPLARAGGNPLAPGQQGIAIFRAKSASTPLPAGEKL